MDVKNALFQYMKQFPMAAKLIREITRCGNVLLFGGCLRAYLDEREHNIEKFAPRDIDIVVDTKGNNHFLEAILMPYNPTRNRFGGYKINLNVLEYRQRYLGKSAYVSIDIWPLDETWAFRNSLLPYNISQYRFHLQDTVFLNIDSIVYDLEWDRWYDEKYKQAMRTRVLDVVLPQNPEMMLNLLRTLVFKKQYHMKLSNRLLFTLKRYIEECYIKGCEENEIVIILMNLQKARYKKIFLTSMELHEEIQNIYSCYDIG